MDLITGPKTSLQYGSILEINLLGPQKVCSYNCVYCDLGPTVLTMNQIRKDYEFPSLEQITTAFKSYITKSVPIDTVVVSGNGEPTLYPNFDEAIAKICELRDAHLPSKKIVILSNGAHLDGKKVVKGMNLADVRVIKVDAGSDALLAKVNDPLVRMNMAKFLSGMRHLKDCVVQSAFFHGSVDNTGTDAIEDWIEVLGMLKPIGVQICTLRAGSSSTLIAPEEDMLYSIAFKLKKRTGLEAQVFR